MIRKIESENQKADILPKVHKVKYLQGERNCYVAGNPSDERECSKKLHLQSYLEMIWFETGYFGLLGNNIILVIILLDLIER